MFAKLCENLNLLMSKANLNASELARRTGLPASTIKKIRNRDNPNPTLSTLLPIAHYFSISVSQLIGDEPLNHTTPSQVTYSVPLLSWTDALTWPHIFHHSDSITTEICYSDKAFALRVENDEWDWLKKDTILICDAGATPLHRDYVIVYKHGQKFPSLKQLLIDEEHTYLKPLTLGYNISSLTSAHKILGVLVEYRKQLKNTFHHENNSNISRECEIC